MIFKLLTKHHLEFLSLEGGCRGSSQSTLVKCQIDGNLMLGLIFNFIYLSWLCWVSNFNFSFSSTQFRALLFMMATQLSPWFLVRSKFLVST